jgi:hypothetical protein
MVSDVPKKASRDLPALFDTSDPNQSSSAQSSEQAGQPGIISARGTRMPH